MEGVAQGATSRWIEITPPYADVSRGRVPECQDSLEMSPFLTH
jgi:hypothetical protein